MLLSRFASASALVAFVGAPALAEDSPVVVVEGDSPRSVTPRKPTGTFEVGVGISPDDGFLAPRRGPYNPICSAPVRDSR
jgi:hypothetical protein